MIKKADLLALAQDRTAIILIVLSLLAAVAVMVSAILRLHASDVQVPVRFTGYGTANIYRDQWYALYMFPLFSIMVAVLNGVLAIKIRQLSRFISLAVLGFTVFLVATCFIVANAIFNLVPSV